MPAIKVSRQLITSTTNGKIGCILDLKTMNIKQKTAPSNAKIAAMVLYINIPD